jgi:hypothetical protein
MSSKGNRGRRGVQERKEHRAEAAKKSTSYRVVFFTCQLAVYEDFAVLPLLSHSARDRD